MAKPIRATPPVEGKDAATLRDAIERLRLAPEEIRRRAAESRIAVDEMLEQKPRPRVKRR